jgi:glycerophosphoryl diester phosphodiesterase
MKNYTGGTIELLLSGDIQTGATNKGFFRKRGRNMMRKLCLFVCLFSILSCSNSTSELPKEPSKLPKELIIYNQPPTYDFPNQDWDDVKNPYRYIAHAGGAYYGYTYTNSLEALNSSLDKGFKLFELDLIKTQDNEIVAAHDWTYWKAITGYTGSIPPLLSEFKGTKIHGSLTPLSMSDIVSWFDKNKEAILVTDKITDYEQLVKEFPFPDRLMVEVFSLEGYVSAYKAGIKYPLLSLEMAQIFRYGDLLIDFIIDNKIPLAVLHTSSVSAFGGVLQALKNNHGYAFAFSSNSLTFLSENKQVFGIYTDFIDFLKQKCDSTVCVSY